MEPRLLIWLGLVMLLGAAWPLHARAQYIQPAPWQNAQWWRNGATLDLDFYNDRYYLTGTQYSGVANFISGAGATFSRASVGTYFDSSGTLQTATSNTPRLDHDPVTFAPEGILIEESRTNSLRNNTMVGAVTGTPGTLPTDWLWGVGSGCGGLSDAVIGSGTVNGMNYVDLKISGTTSTGGGSASCGWALDNGSTITAASGQTWTVSSWLGVSGGSTSNLGAIQLGIQGMAGASQTEWSGSNSSLTSNLTRYSYTYTLTSGSTTNVRPLFLINFGNNVAVNVTFRIGMPQLELGAFPTSVIPTSGSAVTRSADVFTVPTTAGGGWYTQYVGTLGAVSVVPYLPGTTMLKWLDPVSISGTSGNVIRPFINLAPSPVTKSVEMYSAGVHVYSSNGATYTAGNVVNSALAFANANIGAAADGTSYYDDTSDSIPSFTQLGVGSDGAGGSQLDGWLRRIWYMPTRQLDATLPDYTR